MKYSYELKQLFKNHPKMWMFTPIYTTVWKDGVPWQGSIVWWWPILKSLYWLKLLICILLRRRGDYNTYYKTMFDKGFNKKGNYKWEFEPIVGYDYYNYEYEGWTEMSVGKGFFKHWYFYIYSNGT